ncbi:MAG TPA: ribonuclease HI family protein [Patescibacteria group bacterium]
MKESINKVNIYCDGGSRGNPGKAASAFVVKNEEGEVLHEEGRFIGSTTNNVAEYTAVLMALTWLKENEKFKDTFPEFFLDSELVVKQLRGEYKIKNKNLMEFVFKIKELEKEVGKKVSYKNIPRSQNSLADLLVNKTLDAQK